MVVDLTIDTHCEVRAELALQVATKLVAGDLAGVKRVNVTSPWEPPKYVLRRALTNVIQTKPLTPSEFSI